MLRHLAIPMACIGTIMPGFAATTLDRPEDSTRVVTSMEIPVCRSSKHLTELLKASGTVPSDAELATFNAKYKTQRCAYIDTRLLRVISEKGPATIGETQGIIIEVEHLVKKTRWFALSSAPSR